MAQPHSITKRTPTSKPHPHKTRITLSNFIYRCLQNIRPLLSKYKPIAFKIYALPFQNPQSTHTTSDIAIKGIGDDVQDLTTGVTTRSLSGVEGERAGNDTTRSATRVCRRRVESGLGGHEAGVMGDDEGSRRHRPYIETGSNDRFRLCDLQ